MLTITSRRDSKKGRFYEGGLPPGEKYASVTTILQAIGKPALVAWSAKVERQMVMEAAAKLYSEDKALTIPGFLLSLEALLGTEKAHSKELAKAGEIGSKIHELVEWSLRRNFWKRWDLHQSSEIKRHGRTVSFNGGGRR